MSFLRKLCNWLLSYGLFNAFMVESICAFDFFFPQIGLRSVWWPPFVFVVWVPLQMVAPFDAIGFVKKVLAALVESAGLDKEPEPEVWTELVIEEDEPEKQEEPEKQKVDPA